MTNISQKFVDLFTSTASVLCGMVCVHDHMRFELLQKEEFDESVKAFLANLKRQSVAVF